MRDCTITDDFLKAAAQDNDFFDNILFVFVQNNDWYMCIDKGGRMLAAYEPIAESNECLRFWFSRLSNSFKYVSSIDVDVDSSSSMMDVFIEVASKSYNKQLLVSDIGKYSSQKKCLEDKGVRLCCGTEIEQQMQSSIIQNSTEISMGDNSTLILGNNNTIQ